MTKSRIDIVDLLMKFERFFLMKIFRFFNKAAYEIWHKDVPQSEEEAMQENRISMLSLVRDLLQ